MEINENQANDFVLSPKCKSPGSGVKTQHVKALTNASKNEERAEGEREGERERLSSKVLATPRCYAKEGRRQKEGRERGRHTTVRQAPSSLLLSLSPFPSH